MKSSVTPQPTQKRPHEDKINGTVTGQSIREDKPGRLSKSHQGYWTTRVVRRPFVTRDGERGIPPEYSVRMRHLGQDVWFPLHTASVPAAATKARDIYLLLVTSGWEATLEKFKPTITAQSEVATVGEFLTDVGERGHLKPMTLRRYAVKLRKMVADLCAIEAGVVGKAKNAKYDYVNGGRNAWLGRVHAQRLDVLTPEAVNAWRNRYIAKAGTDPLRRKAAERSAASYLRCVRALFSEDVTAVLKIKLPSYPFTGVRLDDPGPQRYKSAVNPAVLVACAERELREQSPQQYLAFVLCFWGGLRRKEADVLMWEQIDLGAGQLHVARTKYFEPKTEESVRSIDLPARAVEVLRKYKQGSTSEFLLLGSDPDPAASYDYYRADATWRGLIEWLVGKGVAAGKPIHSLRKESGSLIAQEFGIEAAREHLGHADIRVTSEIYVRKVARREVTVPETLTNK